MSDPVIVETPDAAPAPQGGTSWLGFMNRARGVVRPPIFDRHYYLGVAVFLVALGLLGPVLFTSLSAQYLLNLWMVYCIAGIGFYWVFGLAGKFAFCQTFMMALGGFMSAWLTKATGYNLPFLVGLIGAMVITGFIALVVGLAVKRAQAFYFAIATLALTEVGTTIFQHWTAFAGPNGTQSGLKPPSLFGYTFTSNSKVFWLFFGVLGIVLFAAAMIERSPLRREAIAARDNFLVAQISGVPGFGRQLTLFVAGSALGGLSGALFGHWDGSVSSSSFGIELAIGLFLMLLLGGVGSMWGPVVGAIFYVAIPQWLSSVQQYSQVIYGVVLLVVVIAVPEGLVGLIRKFGNLAMVSYRRARGRRPEHA